MQCPRCHAENREGRRFCSKCGAKFGAVPALICSVCCFSNALGDEFCGGCGQPLAPVAGHSAEAAARAQRTTSEAERRQLTVMFCDLVGSTELSTRLDPEELRDVVRAYQAACGEVSDRFEGYIAQYLGDGIMVYFGYPVAHEDAAQRAVHTAHGILETVQTLSVRLQQDKGVQLAVRVGIHTGPVVVGELGGHVRQEELAIGETPNVAARLKTIAEPGTVVISASTHRLLRGLFRCEKLGAHDIRGVPGSLEIYRVLGERGFQSRLELPIGLTPLVGREPEVALLLERWERAKEGHGQVVLLSGEPGIGKSRLAQAIRERVTLEPNISLESRCSPYYQKSAFYPLVDLLAQVFQWSVESSGEEKLGKVAEVLTRYRLSPPEVVPLVAWLLSLPLPERYPPLTLNPERQKQKTLEAIVSLLLALASERPMLLIVEDLHWLDPSTLEFLGLLIDRVASAPILTVLVARPEFRPPWETGSHLTHVTLNRFTPIETEVMLERVTGGKGLPTGVVAEIVSKTDGVPLFVEELTKMVVESGVLREQEDRYELVGSLAPLSIPVTLQDSLMARLDRLGRVKVVAQVGATLGRTFPLKLLQAVSPVDEETLQESLARLVDAELLYQRELPPQTTYIFKHALVQEAAYQSMLKRTCQQHHNRIARVLAQQFPETAETQPELLAHHYTEAGLNELAIKHWQRAGERALQRSAHAEASGHFTIALKLLKTLPDTPERDQQELTLQMGLGTSLVATKGLSAPEPEQAYARARELCQQGGNAAHLFPALWGLCATYVQQGKLRTAHELGRHCLTSAEATQDSALLVEAHAILGACLYFMGEFASARAHLEQGLGLYDPDKHRSLAFAYGFDPGVLCAGFMAQALQILGYPDQAVRKSEHALVMARDLAHPQSLAFVLYAAAAVHHFRREPRLVHGHAEAEITLSTDQAFPLWLAWGTIFRGWALAEQREGDEGIAQIRQALAAFQIIQSRLLRPYNLALLADALGKARRTEAGLATLDEALAAAHENGEHQYEAELYRLKGELLLESEVGDRAEGCFRQAIDIARRQQARSWELRATMRLSRLLDRLSRRNEAREILEAIYGRFTEGFDTQDLLETKALLADLS